MRGDARLRALERLVDAGEADPRALLAARDRTREVLLPALPCPCSLLGGGIVECQTADGGACLGWGGEWTPLPSRACVLAPWEAAVGDRRPPLPDVYHPIAVLRRELVTRAPVLVAFTERDPAYDRGDEGTWPPDDFVASERPDPDRPRCTRCGHDAGEGLHGGRTWCHACGHVDEFPNVPRPYLDYPWIDPMGEAADADPYGDWAAEIDRAQGREPEPCYTWPEPCYTCRGVGTVDSWQDGMPGQKWCPECGGAG